MTHQKHTMPDEIWAEQYDRMYWFESAENAEGCYAKGSIKYIRADLVDKMKQERDTVIADLAKCYRLSGADPDGDEDWRLATYAVNEVARLRKENDKVDDEICKLIKERDLLAQYIVDDYENHEVYELARKIVEDKFDCDDGEE